MDNQCRYFHNSPNLNLNIEHRGGKQHGQYELSRAITLLSLA